MILESFQISNRQCVASHVLFQILSYWHQIGAISESLERVIKLSDEIEICSEKISKIHFFIRKMSSSIEVHRSNLYLKFSPQCLPYAEVAQFYLTQKPRENLVLGCDSNLLEATPSLIVPKGTQIAYY